ncbi:hypothetical protein ScPMuIL_015531 [Solemya velum]
MGNCTSKWRKTGANKKAKNQEKERLREERLARLKSKVNSPKEDSSDSDSDSEIEEEKLIAKEVSGLSGLDERDLAAKVIDPKEYDFPFENLVFEGGGNKGLAYCGAIQYLEECGVYSKIKRFAGSSAGAMTAALLAVGSTADDIQEFLSQDLTKIFLDHSCGYMSFLPNMLSGYGWNPGKKIYKWFGEKLFELTQDREITFSEVYDRYNKELCIVVTNLNMMSTEYCHPKTTPDMPIRIAVRMSMAIPGLFQICKYAQHEFVDTYVDGGVLCNYPINCFDGWYLSMKSGDNFMKKLRPLSDLPRLYDERFGTFNEKTLGFLLYAENEQDVLRYSLDKRVCVTPQKKPDTALSREKNSTQKAQKKAKREHHRIVAAVDDFLKVLDRHNLDRDDTISKEELEAAFKDEETFSKKQAELLFGPGITVERAFQVLDRDKSGQIKYHELVHFIEECGISLQTRFLGYDRRHVTGLVSFISTLQSALLTNVKRIHVDEKDIGRTVGINTGHVGTTDFKLHRLDREYVVKQGRLATIAYLKYYVEDKALTKKPEAERVNEIAETSTASKISMDFNSVGENIEMDQLDGEKRPFLEKEN